MEFLNAESCRQSLPFSWPRQSNASRQAIEFTLTRPGFYLWPADCHLNLGRFDRAFRGGVAVNVRLVATRLQPVSHGKPNDSGKVSHVVYKLTALTPNKSTPSGDGATRVNTSASDALAHRLRALRGVGPEQLSEHRFLTSAVTNGAVQDRFECRFEDIDGVGSSCV